MYEQIFHSTKIAAPPAGEAWEHLLYVAPWDAFFAKNYQEWCRVFRDGTKTVYGRPTGGYIPLGRVGSQVAFYDPGNGRIYGSYEINQLPNPQAVLNPSWAIGAAFAPSSLNAAYIDDRRGRYLYAEVPNILRIYDLATGALVASLTHNAGEIFQALQCAQEGQVAGIGKATGIVKIIDYLDPQVVASGRIDPCKVAAFDSLYGNLVSIDLDYKTRGYCREAWPAALAAPVFEPVEVRGLQAHQVTARLTGQDGEPCPGWWVHWELVDLGGGALGYLDKYVSQTDADGYARNLYYGPDDGAMGQCKIRTGVVLN